MNTQPIIARPQPGINNSNLEIMLRAPSFRLLFGERVGCLALLLLAVFFAAPLRAQFQQPTDEELKMTADPKAPGAAAVYLNIEENTDDHVYMQSVYVRIKVLMEKGKELATVSIPYYSEWCGPSECEKVNSVTDIKARTIHSDGTIIPFDGKTEDLLISRTTLRNGDHRTDSRKVFTLPSVEVGSILEYRYQLRSFTRLLTPPAWEIQSPYFVHHERYVYTPAMTFTASNTRTQTNAYVVDTHGRPDSSLHWWTVLPPDVTLKADISGIFKLELSDIPAAPDEEWMPPIKSQLYHVNFYYTYATDKIDFWVEEAKFWTKDVDKVAVSSASIEAAVDALISPGDSELDKAKKLYKAVQALDNTDFSRKKSASEIKQINLKITTLATDTLKRKSGSSHDIAMLYLAMLRTAGLTAWDMKVVDRSQRVFALGYLDFDQLDDDIILLSIGGKEYLLDPGEKMCPFGTLHWKHSGSVGIHQGENVRDLGVTPEQKNYTANKIVRTGDITLDSQGAITGNLNIVMTGQVALAWRQDALRNDSDELKKLFDRWLQSIVPDGIEAHIDHFLGIDDPETNLVAIVNVHGSLGASTSTRLLLPGFFFQSRSRQPFVHQEKRLEPVDMHYPEQVLDQIVYHVPTGLTVEGAPPDNKIDWQGHANLTTKSVIEPGQVTIARLFSRAFTFAKPGEYQDLRDYYQKIAAADQQQLALTRALAAKEN
jgi:transglutaminase-like putative cysteine protease